MPWIIQDWTGRTMNFGSFKTFDDAESDLSERLGENYDTDRGEYEIVKTEVEDEDEEIVDLSADWRENDGKHAQAAGH